MIIAILLLMTLSGCGAMPLSDTDILSGSRNGSSSQSSSQDISNSAIQIAQTSYAIQRNAVNDMCNGGLKLSVSNIQRRPLSVFSGSSISQSSEMQSSPMSNSTVESVNTTDIAIQIDMSYTWNANTYASAIAQAGGTVNNTPSKLKDLLQPGSLLYVTGKDQDGNPYMSASIVTPNAQKDVNGLGINSQWDYDIINSSLPEPSVTKTGSLILKVPSTVTDLKLVMVTPMGGQDVMTPKDVPNGNTSIYTLDLT